MVEQQAPVIVCFRNRVVGEYNVDLLVRGKVILELKSAKSLTDQHDAQLFNYLKATKIEVGLLLNFGPKAEFKRRVYDNERKGSLSWLEPVSVTHKKESVYSVLLRVQRRKDNDK